MLIYTSTPGAFMGSRVGSQTAPVQIIHGGIVERIKVLRKWRFPFTHRIRQLITVVPILRRLARGPG
jgi:hypothetical protein